MTSFIPQWQDGLIVKQLHIVPTQMNVGHEPF